LYDTEKRIELHYTLRKLPVLTPESVYVAFPFHAPDSKMLYEAQGGLVTPGEDQIPGSASDWQTVQSFLAVRSAGGQIITGSEQAPLVQLGDFNLGKWQRVARVEKPHLYSWVMNNYWFTQFPRRAGRRVQVALLSDLDQRHQPHLRHALWLGLSSAPGHAGAATGEDGNLAGTAGPFSDED